MSSITRVDYQEKFYNELIDRLFHSRSYFFVCVTKFLENSSSTASNIDNSILQVLTQFIEYLLKSKHPSGELTEMSQVPGLKNIYSDLKDQLAQSNLRSLKQMQLKKAIQQIAENFMNTLYHILSNDFKTRNILTTYLDIKNKLRGLLNGSNGNNSNKNFTIAHNSESTASFKTEGPAEIIPQHNQPGIKSTIDQASDSQQVQIHNVGVTEQTEEIQPAGDEEILMDSTFHSEAALYYKIIMNAVSQLKKEANLQSAMEDIELASSSLRQLALKFGMEKIAMLPEMVESISIQANKYDMKLPHLIINNIEEGLTLLKEFNPSNSDHKTKFMSLLSSLKDYYSRTHHKTKFISMML